MAPRPPRSLVANALLGALLIAIAVLALQLIGSLRAHERMRMDLAEINDIKYGLLNADAWVQQVSGIIEKKINEFRLTPEKRKALKPMLEKMLDVFVTQADLYLRKHKKDQKKMMQRAKENVRQKIMDMEQVKAGIPEYADKILDEMNTPKARRQLRQFLGNLLADVSESTFAVGDESLARVVRDKYHCENRAECQTSIKDLIEANRLLAVRQALVLLSLTVLLFAGAMFAPGRMDSTRLSLLALCGAVLLACGVLTPMIEVEARISELRFILLGEPVVFTDQILYFQSKSVLDVVQVLTSTGKSDMILVGVLIMTFSVVFPLAKLAASFAYLYGPRVLAQSAVIRFFALKSGKWSMADVFVVAMFMAYIGFKGVISSQLSTFVAAAGEDADVLTTNGTSLQIGFFMFLAFCLASLVTSSLIEASINRDAPAAGGTAR
jgi:hypothetical protein